MKKGISEEIHPPNLSTSTLTDKIRLLLTDTKYKRNAVAASKVFRDRKETPLERGLWWIEWAMRNSDSLHFKNTIDLNYFELHSIDVIAFLTAIFAVIMYGVYVALRQLIRVILCRGSGDKRKRKLE